MSQDLRDHSEHQKKIAEFIERDFLIQEQDFSGLEKIFNREYMNRSNGKQSNAVSEIVHDLYYILSQSRRHFRGTDEKENLIVDLQIIERKVEGIIETIRQYL